MQQYFNCIVFVYIVYIAHPCKGCFDPVASPTPPPILTLKQSTYIEMKDTKFITLLMIPS